MYEDAREIFNYLPIRRNTPENDYINHLWNTFVLLEKAERLWERDQNGFAVSDDSLKDARPFAVMPVHLLFMMAIQYKVLRIYKEQKEKYNLALAIKNLRDEEKDVLAPESPLTIAFLGESAIVDFLKIAGLSADDARNIKKSIIRYRNDKIAHAKGYIELEIEGKIAEYFNWLNILQKVYLDMNQEVADNWLSEIQIGDDMEQFLEMRFLNSCLSPRDFGDIIGKMLEAKQLNYGQWEQIVNKGLELSHDQTILALRAIAENELDDGKRFGAIRFLKDNG